MSEQKAKRDKVGTSKLYEKLFKADTLQQFLSKNGDELQPPPFHEYITQLCHERGEVPERVIKRANIETSYGHQIFKGVRRPSRDTVLQLAFGLEADVDTAQRMLKYAQKSQLYPRIKRDAAVLYCLHNDIPFLKAQALLHDLELTPLGESPKK